MSDEEKTEALCACGQPLHPLYGGRCEDCFSLAQGHGHRDHDLYTDELSHRRQEFHSSSAIGGRYPESGPDRHWKQPRLS